MAVYAIGMIAGFGAHLLGGDPPRAPKNKKEVEGRLDQKITELVTEQMALKDALTFISQRSDIPYRVDQPAFTKKRKIQHIEGALVTLVSVKDTTVRKRLQMVLSQVNATFETHERGILIVPK